MKQLTAGCGYQGYEFGASYPDSLCCGGKLYDCDDCDDEGNLYERGEDVPCPICDREGAIDWHTRGFCSGTYAERRKAARALVADIRRNRENGTEPWKGVRY